MAPGRSSWRIAGTLIDPDARRLSTRRNRDVARAVRDYERLRLALVILRLIGAAAFALLAAWAFFWGHDFYDIAVWISFAACFFLIVGGIRK